MLHKILKSLEKNGLLKLKKIINFNYYMLIGITIKYKENKWQNDKNELSTESQAIMHSQ